MIKICSDFEQFVQNPVYEGREAVLNSFFHRLCTDDVEKPPALQTRPETKKKIVHGKENFQRFLLDRRGFCEIDKT